MTIEEKYKIIYVGNKHYYVEDLRERSFYLENTSPLYLRLENHEIYETSWGALVLETVKYLIDEFEFSNEELLDFKFDWSKTSLFSNIKKANHRLLPNGLYLNLNHTALHACWTIQDFIKFCGISTLNCKLIINRRPVSEEQEVKDYFKQRHKEEFKSYVLYSRKETLKHYDIYIKLIDLTEKRFKKLFPTFESLYYFDEYIIFNNYKLGLIDQLKKDGLISRDNMRKIENALDCYRDYLKLNY